MIKLTRPDGKALYAAKSSITHFTENGNGDTTEIWIGGQRRFVKETTSEILELLNDARN